MLYGTDCNCILLEKHHEYVKLCHLGNRHAAVPYLFFSMTCSILNELFCIIKRVSIFLVYRSPRKIGGTTLMIPTFQPSMRTKYALVQHMSFSTEG